MTNWLKKIFDRVSGRNVAPEQNNETLAERMNRASGSREKARETTQRKRRNTAAPGYGSTSRRTSDDTYIHSPLWYSSGDGDSGSSGSYSSGDSGGSCGGGDGGGGGGGD